MKPQGGNWGTVNRAIVRSVVANGVTVEIPALAPNATWGPIPTAVPNLAVGEAVMVAQVSTSRDTLVVLGRIPGRPPAVSEIPALSSTIAAIQASDSATTAAATALTTRVTTAEGTLTSHGTRLTTDEANITTNTNSITSHGTRLNTDEANITTNTTAIASHGTRLTTDEANIVSGSARISVLEDMTAVGKSRMMYQAADEQIQNNTSYISSSYLTLPVIANGVYIFESQFIYDVLSTVNMKFKFLLPSDAPPLRISPWFSGDAAGNAAIWHDVFDGVEFTAGGKSPTGGFTSCRPGGGLIVGATTGNLTVQFAQSVSNVAYAVLKVGSWLRVTRMS